MLLEEGKIYIRTIFANFFIVVLANSKIAPNLISAMPRGKMWNSGREETEKREVKWVLAKG